MKGLLNLIVSTVQPSSRPVFNSTKSAVTGNGILFPASRGDLQEKNRVFIVSQILKQVVE
jgi:hypothetical protein